MTASYDLSQLNVLLADDNDNTRYLLAVILRSLGIGDGTEKLS